MTDLDNLIRGIKININDKAIIISSKKCMRTLSSAILNGGFNKANFIINLRIDEDVYVDCYKPESHIINYCRLVGLSPSKTIGMITKAEVKKAGISILSENDISVLSIATAGLSNPATAGDTLSKELKYTDTINIIVIIDGNLTDTAFVDAMKTVVEAKVMVMRELDVRSKLGYEMATGTTTDSLVIACTNKGKEFRYAGIATKIGELIGKSVRRAVKDALKNSEGLSPGRSLTKRLEERGVTMEDMLECCMEMLVTDGNMTREKAKHVLMNTLTEYLKDVNVSSLILAAIRLEEEGMYGSIPYLTSEEFVKDPSWLVADEILGMAIANYIAGSKGIFEYIRFDTKKPGILSKLGPFLDDAIGGLLAGISSEMYTRSLREMKDKSV